MDLKWANGQTFLSSDLGVDFASAFFAKALSCDCAPLTIKALCSDTRTAP